MISNVNWLRNSVHTPGINRSWCLWSCSGIHLPAIKKKFFFSQILLTAVLRLWASRVFGISHPLPLHPTPPDGAAFSSLAPMLGELCQLLYAAHWNECPDVIECFKTDVKKFQLCVQGKIIWQHLKRSKLGPFVPGPHWHFCNVHKEGEKDFRCSCECGKFQCQYEVCRWVTWLLIR